MKLLSYEMFSEMMAPSDLNSGSIFGALSFESTEFLLSHGKIWDVAEGEVVFTYGDSGNSFYVVCRGLIEFQKEHGGARFITRNVGVGEEVGFVAMIALHDHVGRAIARDRSLLLEISSTLFHSLYRGYPEDFGLITLNLARDLARTVRKLGNLLVEVSKSEKSQDQH